MATFTLGAAEHVDLDGRRYLSPAVSAGDKVRLGVGLVATITDEGIKCDCGKGVLCPLNPQTRK